MLWSVCAAEAGELVVKIVNKSRLPPDRLAEAIAAKGLLMYDFKLVRAAAAMKSKDPAYWYWASAQCFSWSGTANRERPLLEGSLSAEPAYLPALYAYAVSKPKPDQEMDALEQVAQLDAGNVAPYCLMAVALYEKTVDGRPIADQKYGGVYVMSDAEWSAVLDLVKNGNERPAIRRPLARLPDSRDIAVREGKRRLSPREVANRLLLLSDTLESVSDHLGVANFPTGARTRQLFRQGAWEAKRARLAGRIDASREINQEMLDYARKYAGSEPFRVTPFLIGYALRSIAAKEAAEFCRQTGDKKWLALLQQEHVSWKKALRRMSAMMDTWQKSPCWPYHSVAFEEDTMRHILADMGLTKPPTRDSAPHVDTAPG